MTVLSHLSIKDAADILGIENKASINEIRSRYHILVKEWHPDVLQHDLEDPNKIIIQLNDAYDILIDYCMNYEFSFRPEDIRSNTLNNSMRSWMDQYGDDPIWGSR